MTSNWLLGSDTQPHNAASRHWLRARAAPTLELMTDDALERAAIETFASDAAKERMLFLVGRRKRRPDLLGIIHTSKFLAQSALVKLPAECVVHDRDVGMRALLALLNKLGAGKTWYAISALSNLDGQSVPLTDALDGCFVNTVETLLFDPVGRIGYFEGGHPNDRYILRARTNEL